MLTQFSLRPEDLPSLQKVQNVVCYFRRTKIGGNDSISNVTSLIRAQAFHGNEEEHEPFTFGWQWNDNGQFVVGNGTDENPFLFGITTKPLLRQAARDPATFIFHVDVTYKTNQGGYPVLVCGITDAARQFHLLTLFVTSQQQEPHFSNAFASLRWIYSRVVGQPLRVAMFMGDADSAQFSAAATVFGVDCTCTHLMGYYHFLAKVVERAKGLSKEHSDAVLRDVYKMHCTRNAQDFDACVLHAYLAEQALLQLAVLSLSTRRDYTVHRLLKIGELLQQLRSCCRQHSIDVRQFAVTATPSKELLSRVRALQHQQLIHEYTPPRMGLDLLLGTMVNIVNVLYVPPLRVYNAATKRFNEHIQVSAKVSANTARLETDNQPATGWPVDTANHTCPCGYFYKYTSCVHLLFAMQRSAVLNDKGEEVLFNRRRTTKPSTHGVGLAPTAAGRPRRPGPALEIE
ncbi:hypothetical protein PHMEG_00019283 [Phytophthora megakarya]|uniref:MULE transposase domain-containing protein n=1 Tax=Phytophthora megakarya TaxID=4795 RepID=A0A225VRZ8_9STRA|nr:hypothetical protein PHMEG_00019283 [Phytophthora megakarya]